MPVGADAILLYSHESGQEPDQKHKRQHGRADLPPGSRDTTGVQGQTPFAWTWISTPHATNMKEAQE